MLTADAEVPTDRATRYLVQLCRHLGNKGRHLSHRPRMHGSADSGRPLTEAEAARVRVEWTETRGDVDFGWGSCTLTGTPDALLVHAEAADEESLQRIRDVITVHLGRFSRRDPLTVRWQGEPGPPGQNGRPMDATTAVEHRSHHESAAWRPLRRWKRG
jgi:hypothetical protein